ncbi:MAG: hypothetical protein AAGK21_14930 [Bacteroidota bacterium]
MPVAVSAQSDPVPVRYVPSSNGAEGCYAQWTTRSAVRAYSAPTSMSRHIRTVGANRRIDANDYTETIEATLESGLARVRQAATIQARRLSPQQDVSLQVEVGDELSIVGYGAEGYLFFEYENLVYGAFLNGFYGTGDPVEDIRRPVQERWVRLIEHGEDRPAAWLNTAEAGVVPREAFCL